MPSFTLKNIPESLMNRLRQRAQRNHRSLAKELQLLLETTLEAPEALSDTWPAGARETEPRYRAMLQASDDKPLDRDTQVEAWRDLCGQWQSDLDSKTEIEAVYAARTAGQEVDL